MSGIITKYGVLEDVSSLEYYANGQTKSCIVNTHNELATPVGVLVPQYQNDNVRRKYIKSLSFYENGNLKSIALHEQSTLKTSVGSMKAELITFYENESLKRVFPLNGKMSGFWSEENEYELADVQNFKFSFGVINKKIISTLFYVSGQIKSITLWPHEIVSLQAPSGLVDVRIGFGIYPNGELKSCEPVKPFLVSTPIGNITAYDVKANGISGDKNSLNYYEDGSVKSLVTSTDSIEIISKDGDKVVFEPSLKPSLFNLEIMEIVPLTFEFYDNSVKINNSIENVFKINENSFSIKKKSMKAAQKCTDCSSCTACQ